MLYVQVLFADPKYNYRTSINGPLDKARAYFVGQAINFGDRHDGDPDNLQIATGVELVEEASARLAAAYPTLCNYLSTH